MRRILAKWHGLSKPMRMMLISVGILFGFIFLYKVVMNLIMHYAMKANDMPVITVSAAQAQYASWQSQLKVVGTLNPVEGVNVTAELGGMIRDIPFAPGATVKKGTVLVQQNADPEIAQLHSLEANAWLAKVTYDRDKKQLVAGAVSQQTVDSDLGNLKSLQAQVEEQTATVVKKTIKAPFDGRLGICLVNTGQYLNPGDAIVSLQAGDPIYLDFYVPQQNLGLLKLGQALSFTTDSIPNQLFNGKISTINPIVDEATRNVELEATIPNPHYQLYPGMFVSVQLNVGEAKRYLTLPQSAITFNPYGDIVFLIHEKEDEQNKNSKKAKRQSKRDKKKGKSNLVVEQIFVTTGDTRGDQIAILSGLNEGDLVVTSGQVKLKNGMPVVVNNSVVPQDAIHPGTQNEIN